MIAEPMRTWARRAEWRARNRRSCPWTVLQPVARGDRREQREMRRGLLIDRRHAHQPGDLEPILLAALRHEGVASCGRTPAFCGSSPVLTCTSSRGRRPWRAISAARASAIFGRSTLSMTSKVSTASRALLDCSGPMRCSSTSGKIARAAAPIWRAPPAPCSRRTRDARPRAEGPPPRPERSW